MRPILITSMAIGALLAGCSSSPTGSVRLEWHAPSHNVDGSPLQNLEGYRVYWRGEGSDAVNQVEIRDPSASSYELTHLADGTWHIGVSAISPGGESDLNLADVVIEDGERADLTIAGASVPKQEFLDTAQVVAETKVAQSR